MKRKIHLYRAPFYIGLYLLILLVIIRALLPFWVRDYVNRKLSEVPEYRGHVAAVTMHLWRGAYQMWFCNNPAIAEGLDRADLIVRRSRSETRIPSPFQL
jgi:hypothetical protein